MTRASRAGRWLAVLAATTLLVTACGPRGGDQDGSEPEEQASQWEPGMLNIAEAGDPTPGGELVFAGLAEPTSFDPTVTIVSGLTGGIVMGAVYDSLMRYDAESGDLVPQMAESLESNDDYTTWTMKLRDGVKFSNGATVDADAVMWSLNRYVARPSDESKMWQQKVSETKAVDDLTLEFTLTEAWPTFGYMFTTGPGMIVAEGSDGATPADFKPIGAGPYTLTKHAPGEEIVLTARDDYWGGEVNIESVRAVYLGSPETTGDSYDSGTVQLVAMNDAPLAQKYLDEDTQMFLNMVPLGRVAMFIGNEGPGADVRLRKAAQLAIDPQVVLDRAFGGVGVASDEVFPELSTWHDDVAALGYDPEEAKKLVEEAKADGFDGKLTYTFVGTPSGREQALAIKAQLDAVGFEIELDSLRTTGDLISQVYINQDYQLTTSGLAWREAEPWARMAAVSHSGGNTTGKPTSPELDALIDDFGRSADHDEKVKIAGQIQQEWNELVPAVVFGPSFDYVIWSDQVHGIKSQINNMVLLDDAWIEN